MSKDALKKREYPQLKNTIVSKLEKWNHLFIDEVVNNGSLNNELTKTYREIVADLEEIKVICERRGRY